MLGPVTTASFLMNTAVASQSAYFGQMANQGIQELAWTASPSSDPVALQRMEKALMFQGIQAHTNYLVAQARLEGAQRLRKEQTDLDRRLMDAGAIFV